MNCRLMAKLDDTYVVHPNFLNIDNDGDEIEERLLYDTDDMPLPAELTDDELNRINEEMNELSIKNYRNKCNK